MGQFALRKAQAAHAPPSSLALQSVQRHKEPLESLFVLRASAHTVGHVLRNHIPHLGAMDCPMRYGALLPCFHMLVGGDWTGWLGREDSNLCIPEISMRSFTCQT